MIRHISIVLSVVLALILASCGDKQLDTIYDSQEGNIAAIVESLTKSNESATVERNNGTVRVTVVPGEGAPLGDNGAVAFYYAGFYITGRSLSNNTLFATNYETFANSAKWAVSDSAAFNIATIRLGEDEIVSGLRDGLVGVKGGRTWRPAASPSISSGRSTASRPRSTSMATARVVSAKKRSPTSPQMPHWPIICG